MGVRVRDRRTTRQSRRSAPVGAALALAGTVLLSGCTTEPEPEPDPLQTSSTALRDQLEKIDGITEIAQEIGGLEYTLEFAIDDSALAEQATSEALDALHESDVPAALAQKAAEYTAEPRMTLRIVELGSRGAGPHLDLPITPEVSTATLATGVSTWAQMGAIDGVELRTGTFAPSGFTLRFAVDYEGLLAGVRPTAVTPQLTQILTDNGFDPAASTIVPAISAPEAVNTVGGKEKYVQGTRFARAAAPVKAIAGPNYDSVMYFIPGHYEVDLYVLPALAADGALLPLDFTEESMLAARQEIQTTIFSTTWELRDVIVFTQEGTQVFGSP